MKQEIRHGKPQKIKRVRLITGLLGIIVFAIVLNVESYAYWQTDPRIPAANHTLSAELAPAIGRIRSSSNTLICTAWIAPGGVLITAGHCNILGDILEFNVPGSASCGQLSAANSKDQYVITNIVASNDGGFGNDWKIFEVQDNPVTGYQPIEAQLKYINFVKPDVDLTSIPTVRQISYGIDTSPNGSCSGGGTLNNSSSGTLQTAVGDNLTSGPTSATLITDNDDLWFSSGSSGSPIIDESTGNAIAINNGNDGQQKGTTLYRSGFWTAFQNTQTSVSLSVYQKNEGGSNISGSTIGHWNGTGFAEQAVDGSSGATKLSIATQVGNVEVLRGDQDVFLNPKEKFNRWNNQEDVRNHQRFQMEPGMTQLTSQFKNTQSTVTIKNYYPEYTSSGAGGLVAFKDPWLIDYADPDFNNETRNRGFNAEFVTHTAPFAPGFSAINGKLYNGIFIDESGPPLWSPPYYSVEALPQTINFGGVLGNRETTFYEWTGVNADFQDADEEETAVVFTSSTAEARANLKISNVTNVTANNGATGQRKIVRTSDGFLHRVYESMGHIWYEAKSPTGGWEIIKNIGGRLTVDETGGKSPSIDVSSFSYPDPNNVTIVWQEGGDIKMQIFEAHNGSYTWHMDGSFSTGMSSTYDTKPNIAWSGINEFTVVWHTTSGIKFRIYYIGGTLPYYSYFSLRASGTISGTNSSSVNAAVSADKDFPYSFYELAWVQNGSGGASSIKYKNFYANSSTAYQSPSTPLTVSSSADFSNTNVSIMTTPDYAVIGWACRSTSSWNPMSSKACLRTYDGSSLSSFSTFNQSVASVSLAKSGTGNDYYFAWSEKYYYPESQYNNDVNKYVKKGAFSNKRTLNTTAPNIQLYHAPSGSDMKLSAFYTSTPKYYTLSNTLETSSKVAPGSSFTGRGVFVSNEDAGTYFEVGSILIDGQSIAFAEIPDYVPEGDRLERIKEGGVEKKKSLEEVTPLLITELFELSETTSFTFTEQFGIGDSVALVNLLGENGNILFNVELVNESNTEVIATLKTVKLSSGNLYSQLRKDYQVNIPASISGKARLRIVPESNIPGLAYEVSTYYRDESSNTSKEKEELVLEELDLINDYLLAQNYPNPFNPTTQIEYQIPTAGLVQLEVFDILGRKVQTLVNENKEVGKYTITFDASGLASGMYLYRLTSGTFVASKKLFLMK